jgi:hypothetical protein
VETKYEAWNKASPEKSAEAIAPKGLPKGGLAAMNEGGGPNLGGWGSMEVTESRIKCRQLHKEGHTSGVPAEQGERTEAH